MHERHHHLAKLWAHTAPSGAGIAVVALLALLGIVLVLWLLRSHEGDERSAPVDDAARALRGIARARARLLAELGRTEGPLRAALSSMIEPPLRELDARTGSLVATARATVAESPDLEGERARVRSILEGETDPRARTLLEAQLRDLDGTARAHGALARSSRLALLELDRMRTLLETLPLRVHELAVRQIFDRNSATSVEAIAQELELAVQSTGDVLQEVRG